MKLKHEFVVRNILDEYILVPCGDSALSFGGMISTSEVGAFLINALKNDVTREDLAQQLMQEYEVDEDTAYADLDEFLEQLNRLELLENQ